MKIINGFKFYDIPYICGECPASDGHCGSNGPFWRPPSKCTCLIFDLTKRYTDRIPKRCRDLFERGFKLESERLSIVFKD